MPASPKDLPGIGKTEPVKGFDKESDLSPKQSSSFQSYMETPATKVPAPSSEQISPLDLAKSGFVAPNSPTMGSILEQMQAIHGKIDTAKTALKTPNLKLKKSQQKLIENKLEDSFEHLQVASKHMDAEVKDLSEVSAKSSPIVKYLSYLTDGQNQLEIAKSRVSDLAKSGNQIKPAELMLIQISLSQAQQEVEYCSILLNQVVSAIKQTMSIQI